MSFFGLTNEIVENNMKLGQPRTLIITHLKYQLNINYFPSNFLPETDFKLIFDFICEILLIYRKTNSRFRVKMSRKF